MALRASATVRSPTLPTSPPPRKSFSCSKLTPKSLSPSAKTTLPLFVLFTVPHEANALAISKEQIVSSLDQVESTINQVQVVGSNIFDVAGQVIGGVLEAVKPGVDVALPILKEAGEQAVKIASPVVSEVSKKAQETMQSSGIDTQPVISAAKTVVDAAQQTTKVIDEVKPIATSSVETISSADPVIIVVAGGALFLAYLLLPPVLSAISFGFRGYKGDLTPAQTLDLMSTKNYLMIDIRSEKDKNKAGVPRLPSSAKNKVISIPRPKVMALRASATVRSPTLPPSPPPRKSFSCSKLTPKSLSPSAKTTLPLFVLFTVPYEANALAISKEQIVSSLDQVESTINQVQEVGSNIFDVARQVIGGVLEAVKPGVDVALPILKEAGEQAAKIASPVVSEVSKKAQETMQSSGIDTQPVISATKTVVDAAQQTTKVIDEVKPIATSTVETISSADPVIIVVAGGALFLAYLLLPPVFSAISFGFRGYKGDLTPAQTLDLMSTKNYLMIDIRSEKDKNKAGVPRLPSKNKLISIPLEELPSKIRSLVKSVKKVEAELVALKISYLKRIGKGSNIVILDSYSDSAKIVARALSNLGFKNCWVVIDGFSGSKGWSQSRLEIDSYNLSFAEIVSPSRIIPAASKRFSTSNSSKLLRGGGSLE
ncbi:unnamed protein product [Fraxinus pennsylvanica]|uniref:Rhodanese domain-containing protein n=1 Tax=Fraxinus pennsylvanica TaxID=56036 RepID=A0AAD1YNE8_9LAMI|nr:unnamed protein product [Fraxinus pennsylvanica]